MSRKKLIKQLKEKNSQLNQKELNKVIDVFTKNIANALINGNRDAYPDSGVYEHSINLGNILAEDKQNTLAFHWKKAEDDYPLHYFLRDLNEGSLK